MWGLKGMKAQILTKRQISATTLSDIGAGFGRFQRNCEEGKIYFQSTGAKRTAARAPHQLLQKVAESVVCFAI
jgi:hypothetical protein